MEATATETTFGDSVLDKLSKVRLLDVGGLWRNWYCRKFLLFQFFALLGFFESSMSWCLPPRSYRRLPGLLYCGCFFVVIVGVLVVICSVWSSFSFEFYNSLFACSTRIMR